MQESVLFSATVTAPSHSSRAKFYTIAPQHLGSCCEELISPRFNEEGVNYRRAWWPLGVAIFVSLVTPRLPLAEQQRGSKDSVRTRADQPSSASGEHARFERLATLRWHLPFCPAGGSPWSPSGTLLAVDSSGRLGVFDASRPQVPPRTLLAMSSPTSIAVSWSPDGRWIACRTKTYSRPNGNLSISDTLWVIPVTDGGPTVAGSAVGWPFLWGSDGILYWWDDAQASRFVPPAPPSPQEPDRSRRVPGLAEFLHQGIARVTPGDPPEVAPLHLGQALLHGTFRDGRRFLVQRIGSEPRSVVVSATGEVLASLDGAAREDSSGTLLRYFSPNSVTAQGRYIIGFYEVDTKDGDNIAKAVVFLTDTTGTSRIPVDGANYSTRAECSILGTWLALEVLSGGVEVGKLIEPR